MRVRLLLIVVFICVLWAGWWLLAINGLHRGLEKLVDAQPHGGWRITAQDVTTSGFPLWLVGTLQRPTLILPDTGATVVASRLELSAPAWWPGYVTLKLPDTPIAMTHALGVATLTVTDASAALRLRPGAALSLESAVMLSGPWTLAQAGTDLLSAQDLRASVAADSATGATYEIEIDAQRLTPADVMRAAFALPADWPQSFDDVTADLSVTLDRPLNRKSLGVPPPQPRAIDLRRVAITWGAMQLTASGQIAIDAAGVPSGEVEITAKDWSRMLDMASAAGLVPANLRGQTEMMMRALAGMSGQTDSLALDLRFAQGRMALGAIDLGPAPRLVLR
jgi:hypothetical protein